MTRIGDIVIGAAASKNNMNTTGTPFLIPRGIRVVYLRTTANDVTYKSAPDAGTLSSPSTLTADANDFQLAASQAFPETLPPMITNLVAANSGPSWCVACYSTGGATVKVYGVLA